MNRKILAIVGAALILIVGGAAFYMRMNKLGPFADSQAEEATAAPAAEPPPRIVAMDVLSIPVIVGNNVSTIVQIQIELQTKTAEGEAKLRAFMPRLNDAFLSDMHDFIPRLMKNQTRLDPAVVGQRLKIVGDRAIGEGFLSGIEVKQIADTSRRAERPAAPAR